MRLLIDECLHTSLVEAAHKAGFAAVHVSHMGMSGLKGWQLIETIAREEYTLVTNNRTDFLALYGRQRLHPGLVVIVPNVTPAQQAALFQAALAHIGQHDLVNTVVEVELGGGGDPMPGVHASRGIEDLRRVACIFARGEADGGRGLLLSWP